MADQASLAPQGGDRSTNAADDLPLVFVHGSGDTADVWQPLIAHMGGLTAIALDLPGHGDRTDRPGPAAMSVDDYAHAVRCELTRRGLTRVCLVGHSLGSAIALTLALDHPALVPRLVLVGAGARLRVLPALLEGAAVTPEASGQQLVALGYTPEHRAAAAEHARERGTLAPGILHRDLAACDAFDVMDRLAQVAQPTLIVVGAQDRLTPPKYATYLQQHISHSELVVVEGAGHYVQREAPDTVAQAISTWLRQR